MKSKPRSVAIAFCLILLLPASAQAYYSPEQGRWINRDPLEESGGQNSYGCVRNNNISHVDALGLQAYPPPRGDWLVTKPRIVRCGGICGAIIDGWIIAEINAQIAGWNNWKRANPGKGKIGDYLPWANGNQRYKDPNFFQFNKDIYPKCATKEGEIGCGASVTLCGKCVRSSILGNIMYGIIGRYAGFSDLDLGEASRWKKKVGMPVDKYDEEAYRAGVDLTGQATIEDFCKKFDNLLKNTTALREGRSDGGYNDLSSCRTCSIKTTATNHGGNEPPRLTP